MATHGWRTGRTLNDQLIDEGSTFNYFQLMRLLDLSKSRSKPGAQPNTKESAIEGATNDFEPEKGFNWRIIADLEAAFPVSEIRSIEIEKNPDSALGKNKSDEQTVIARTSNYCIAGHQGPLPENYTDWIREQQRYGPSAMAAFLDMFNHRINMLRYEVKKDSCLALDNSRPDEGLLAPGISAAMGMLGKNLFEQLPLSKRSIMSLSGILSGRRISAHSIQRILQKCFGIKTRITDIVGAWRDVAPDQFWRLGQKGVSDLGELCVLGQKNMDMQGRVRVELGPMHIDQYLALLPDLEFSRNQIKVPIRSEDGIEQQKYHGHKLSYQYSDQDQNTETEGHPYIVSNIRLNVEPGHKKETLMLPSAFSRVSKGSSQGQLRAIRFAGYLYRPFSALIKYLTNSKVDIEVLLEVDPGSLPAAYPALCTPERPQDAYLRLGQSFWLGRPDSEEYSRATFLIDGFEPAQHSALTQ